MKKKIIAIVGPTASGKSELAIKIAQNINSEIISADSRLVYKGFEIVCAKPTQEEMCGIKHHMMNCVNPTANYTVANFADEAKKIIKKLHKENKIPIVAGGTGLYFRMLLENYEMPRVAPNYILRAELEKQDTQKLYKELEKADKEIANKIHPNNKTKIIRALEVMKTLNIKMSEAQRKKESEYDVLWLGLNAKNRDFLYEKINERTKLMFSQGAVEETKKLYKQHGEKGVLKDTIGYKEIIEYIKGQKSEEEVIDNIQQNTRRYAKRQLTWFRQNDNINWFYIDEELKNTIFEKAILLLNTWK